MQAAPNSKPEDSNIEKLFKYWEDKSLQLMQKHAQMSDITMSHYDNPFPVHKHWLTMSNLSSQAFKIRFKLFFTQEDGKPFCTSIFKTNKNNIQLEQLIDFAKEYCNLVVGRIKVDFEKHQFHCVSSLPMSLRSMDDLLIQEKAKRDSHIHKTTYYEDYWKFTRGPFTLINFISIEVIDPKIMNELKFELEESVQEGTFEIL